MIHIYTGRGKGKTTAAFGLALRTAGTGERVYIIQFLKKGVSSELKSLTKLPRITIKQFGRGCLIRGKPTKKDKELAEKALSLAEKIIDERKYKVLILDEINIALKFKLLSILAVINFLKSLPESIEVILTGRFAPKQLISLADYVTEMKEIKHPFKRGIPARKGIEF